MASAYDSLGGCVGCVVTKFKFTRRVILTFWGAESEVPMYVLSVVNWSKVWHSVTTSVYPWYGDTLETEMKIRRREARVQQFL